MTGYGEAQESTPDLSLRIEVRSVNNRHLKVVVRGSDPFPQHEAEFEKLVRKTVRRGSVLIHARATRSVPATDAKLNTATIEAYLDQLEEVCRSSARRELLPHLATGLLGLPGIAPEHGSAPAIGEEEWLLVERVLNAALDKLQVSRRQEGRAMAEELESLNSGMLADLGRVKELIPGVGANYRKRIVERIRQAVAEAGIAVEPEHLIREVAIFADRTDVSEEVMRLAAHAEQFAELVKVGAADGAGRRLEFVVQEMGREINTLGSKAGDVAISRLVIEMKASLEKVRELIQNVE
jgi:uncharacterized protein (TIGR00255 family)